MKAIILTVFILSFSFGNSQNINQEIKTENGHQFLVGPINIDRLKESPYKNWYDTSYNNYQIDNSLLSILQDKLKNYEVKLFLGTWCGDSKREVPRMVKILEAANYPADALELIALDKRKGAYKKSPGGEEKGWNIIKIPTLILIKDGKEVNRIVESPVESLEEDILAILNDNTYIPNYSSN